MQNQSVKKQPQSETGTKENLNRLEWTVPTLADLLQRLSVASPSPSKPS
jgi:hypothetical protein